MMLTRNCSRRLLQRRPIFDKRLSSTLNYFQNKQNAPLPGINPNNPQYASYYKPERKPWGQIFLYSLAAMGLTGYVAYELFWPKHTFPPSVAKILRKGLWAESEKEDHNYERALHFYKEALDQCDVEELSHISDEYTGIQIKIGEMCEKLGKVDEAIDVYYDISQNYFKYLQSNVHRPSSEETRHIVQKDLRIVVKIAELSKDHIPFLTSLLSIHLDLALHEVVKRLILRGQLYEDLIAIGKNYTNITLVISPDGNVSDPAHNIDPEIWEPFRDEYFNARELLSALYLVTKGPAWTSTYKTQTLSWMLLAKCSLGDLLLNMCNLASLCYLAAESLEGEELRLRRKLKELTEENFASIDTKLSYDGYRALLQKEISTDAKLREIFINRSLDFYTSAMKISKKVSPQKHTGESKEAVVLATYGAGVVNLHIGNYDEAEQLLKEAILRAKGSGNEYQLKELERELNKLNSERERISNGGPSNQELKQQREGDAYLDIQFERNK